MVKDMYHIDRILVIIMILTAVVFAGKPENAQVYFGISETKRTDFVAVRQYSVRGNNF